jgi:3',5'-cyclic-AMP phosphodiesterase
MIALRRRSAALILAALPLYAQSPAPAGFRFALLGDRTGEAQPGVYEQIWKQIASEKPAFVACVGDSIEGLHDDSAADEWRALIRLLQPFARLPLYLAPGNHDVWSAASERLFQQYAKHPLHYSFDYAQAHFTILDNSRSDQLPPGELAFLEADLKAHATQPLKFIVSHRPSWLLDAAVRNSAFALHQLAKQYGVEYVIAGHIHQMIHLELDGVTYLSLPSSGGHLRLSGAYDDGWFFAHELVTVHGKAVEVQVEEVTSPRGEGRVTKLADWGMTGLVRKEPPPPK